MVIELRVNKSLPMNELIDPFTGKEVTRELKFDPALGCCLVWESEEIARKNLSKGPFVEIEEIK